MDKKEENGIIECRRCKKEVYKAWTWKGYCMDCWEKKEREERYYQQGING